jgi:hypothetical protein
MKKIAVVFCVVFSFAAAGLAQTARRTVTNADLAKFESRRVEAERQYRETYAQKGMLSPEEVKSLNDKRIEETINLAARLNAAELEQQRLALAASAQQIELQQMQLSTRGYPAYYSSDGTIWGYGYTSGFGRRVRGRFPVVRNQGWYAAGGNVWSAPVGTAFQRPQPAFRVSRPVVRGGGGRRH